MGKRGQVTIIVIVAVVVLFAFAFVYFLRQGYIEKVIQTGDVSKRLELVFDSIKQEQINPCIQKETKKAFDLIGENGGYLNSLDYGTYYGQKYTVLCKPIAGELNKCSREVLDLHQVEDRLNKYLDEQFFKCIDLSAYRGKDYDINSGDISTNVSIYPKNVLISINYPISVRKGVVNFNISEFRMNVDVPLMSMLGKVNEILNLEAENGYAPIYDLSGTSNRYEIRKYSVAPYKFYIFQDIQDNFVFKFAVKNVE